MNIFCFLGLHRLSSETVESPPGFSGRSCTRCSYVKLLKPPSTSSLVKALELTKEGTTKEIKKLVASPEQNPIKSMTVKTGSIGYKKVSYTVTFPNKPPELTEFTVRFRVIGVSGKEITTSVLSVQGAKEPRHRESVIESWVSTFSDLRGVAWE